jgi:hypothetical protein
MTMICTIAKVQLYDTPLNASLGLFPNCHNVRIPEHHPFVDKGLFIAEEVYRNECRYHRTGWRWNT